MLGGTGCRGGGGYMVGGVECGDWVGVGVALVMGGLTGTTGGYDVVVLLSSTDLTV